MSDTPARRFVLVTGLSGAGKSQALRFLEDLGYYCVDNLPASLVPTFAELITHGDESLARVAICVDARSGGALQQLPGYLDAIAESGMRAETVFLDCTTPSLIQRYSETRRRHPLASEGNVAEAIEHERALLEAVRGRADLVLDTSQMSVGELRDRISQAFAGDPDTPGMQVTVMSFGFKYGLPQEADVVIDVRFLPNPHYDPELRPMTGNDRSVRDFVLENPEARDYLEQQQALLALLLPRYEREPKSYLTIAVGCTGGRHRSVAVANALAAFIGSTHRAVRVRHRDAARPV